MIRRVRHVHARSKIYLPFRRQIQINHWENLLRLLIDGIELRHWTNRTVIFHATRDLLCEIKTDFHIRRKLPSLARIQPVQRLIKRRIEIEIPAPELLVDDRPQFVIPRIFRKLPPLVPDLLRNTHAHRPVPRFRRGKPRPNMITHPVPSRIVRTSRLNAREHIKSGFKPVRPALRNLQGFMFGVVGGHNAVDHLLRSIYGEIRMDLHHRRIRRRRLGAIDLDFVVVLRGRRQTGE